MKEIDNNNRSSSHTLISTHPQHRNGFNFTARKRVTSRTVLRRCTYDGVPRVRRPNLAACVGWVESNRLRPPPLDTTSSRCVSLRPEGDYFPITTGAVLYIIPLITWLLAKTFFTHYLPITTGDVLYIIPLIKRLLAKTKK